MKKVLLVGVSILTIALLVLGSMNTVVGYQTIKTSQKSILKDRIKQARFLQNNNYFNKIFKNSSLLSSLPYLIFYFLLILSIPITISIAVFTGITFLFLIKISDKLEELGMNFNNSIFYRFIDALTICTLAVFLVNGLVIFYLFNFIVVLIAAFFGLFPPYHLLINRINSIYLEKDSNRLKSIHGTFQEGVSTVIL
jgi:hypothetical protein